MLAEDEEIFVAFSESLPIAIFSIKKGSAETWLLDDAENVRIMGAYAKEEYRHKGIGKALLRQAIERARTKGCCRLYVEGESANI